MPSPRQILIDIALAGADPAHPYTTVGATGRLRCGTHQQQNSNTAESSDPVVDVQQTDESVLATSTQLVVKFKQQEVTVAPVVEDESQHTATDNVVKEVDVTETSSKSAEKFDSAVLPQQLAVVEQLPAATQENPKKGRFTKKNKDEQSSKLHESTLETQHA